MRSTDRIRRDRSGFTLIEITVVALVGTLILVALAQTAFTTIRTHAAINETLSATRVGPIVLDLMTRDLEGCYIPDTDEIFFKGVDSGGESTSDDKLHFVTTANSILTEEGKHADYIEVSYLLAESKYSGFKTLWRREQPYLDDQPLKGGKFIELYDVVKKLNIEYYDAEDEDWEETWEIQGEAVSLGNGDEAQDDDDAGKNPGDGQGDGGQGEGTGEEGGAAGDPAAEELAKEQQVTESLKKIKFPDAVRIQITVGIPPPREDWGENDVVIEQFETILSIPAASRMIKEEEEGGQPGPKKP